MNKASLVIKLLESVGIEPKVLDTETDLEILSDKYYVWSIETEDIIDGPFDTEGEAKKSLKDGQEVVLGSDIEIVGYDDDDDDYEEEDESYKSLEGESFVVSSKDESSPSKVVSFSGGKKRVKLVCGPGYKLSGKMCVKMDAQEIAKRKKAYLKGKSKRARGAKVAMKLRRISMKKRKSAGF